MEQKINLFLQNLRRLLDEKMQSGSNTTYGQSATLTDEQFEQVITDFGRLSREELVQLLTPIYTSPDWGNLIASLTESIVSDVIITGTGKRAEISYRTGNKTITQKIQETAPADTTTDTTTTGKVGATSPGMDPDFDPGKSDPNDPNSSAGIAASNTPQVTAPNDLDYTKIQEILAKYQNPNISPEELNRFNAWFTWYKDRFLDLYAEKQQYPVSGFTEPTASGGQIAIWAALIAADGRSTTTEMSVEDYEQALVEKADPNTIRVQIQAESVDSRGNVTTIPQTVDITIDNPELFSKLMESGFVNSIGTVDGERRLIELYPGSWIELRDALRSPAMLGIDADADTVMQLTEVYTQMVGTINQYNPLSPRDNQLPALSAELLRSGLTWSYDHINQRHELIDLLPWIGPSPAAVRWIPLDPNQIDGPGTWEIDQSVMDDELGIGKSLMEGVPTSVRPWLQAVLNAGGDLTIIDQAFPEGDETGARQAGIIKHWVGYILGQARLASDPRYAKQPVSIPMGAGVPPLQVGQFDLNLPGFTASTMSGYDYGIGARAGLATGASDILAAGASWQERWANAQSLGQLGAAGREGSWPPMYRAASGDTAGQATVAGTQVMNTADIIAAAQKSLGITTPAGAAAPAGSTDVGGVDDPAGRQWVYGDNNQPLGYYTTTDQMWGTGGETFTSADGRRRYSVDNLSLWQPTDGAGNPIGSAIPQTSDYGALDNYYNAIKTQDPKAYFKWITDVGYQGNNVQKSGNTIIVTNADGTKIYYDINGNVIQQKDTNTGTSTYTYTNEETGEEEEGSYTEDGKGGATGTNADGSSWVLNPDGSFVNYDKDGNITSSGDASTTQTSTSAPTGPSTQSTIVASIDNANKNENVLVEGFTPGVDSPQRGYVAPETETRRAANDPDYNVISAYEQATRQSTPDGSPYDPMQDFRVTSGIYTPTIRTEGLGDIGNIESLAPATIQGNPTNRAQQIQSQVQAAAANDAYVEAQFNDYLLGQGMNPKGVTGVNAVRAYTDFMQQGGPQAPQYGFPAVEDTTASELGGPVGMTGQPGSMTFPQTQKAQIGPLSQTQANYDPADPTGLGGPLGNVEQVTSKPTMADIRAQDLSLQQTPQEAWSDYWMGAGQVGGQENLYYGGGFPVNVPKAPTYDTSKVVPQYPPNYGEGFDFTPVSSYPSTPSKPNIPRNVASAAQLYDYGSEVGDGVGYTGGVVDTSYKPPKPKPVQEQLVPYPPGHRLYKGNR